MYWLPVIMARPLLVAWRRAPILPRQARRLGAGVLDLLDRPRRARGEHLGAPGRDQDVVLDARADAAELLRDRVHERLGFRLLLLLELPGGGHAEAEAAVPHLVLAVLAQVEGRARARRVHVEAGLDGQDHAGLEPARLPLDLVGADVVDVHAEPVPGAVHEELAVVVHRERLLDAPREI